MSSNMGQIQVIFGPMFSGKSTELIRRLKRYQIARYECLIIKYSKDTRYDEKNIATHDRQTLKASMCAADRLGDLQQKAKEYDVIGIDEGQFFPDIVTFCEEMSNAGKTVVVAALDATFQRKWFENIVDLVPLAEHVVKLTAVCMCCFGEASYTKRISQEKEVEVIGGAEMYMAVCRKCFHTPNLVPASPRDPLKEIGEECARPPNHNRKHDAENTIPIKKALFDNASGGDGVPVKND